MVETMTKSELHNKKRKRPRNRGPNKKHEPTNRNNNENKNNHYEEEEIASGSAKRGKLKEPSKPSSFLEKAYPTSQN